MTANQINWQNHLEAQRHNEAQEDVQLRVGMASAGASYALVQEQQRHNLAMEDISNRQQTLAKHEYITRRNQEAYSLETERINAIARQLEANTHAFEAGLKQSTLELEQEKFKHFKFWDTLEKFEGRAEFILGAPERAGNLISGIGSIFGWANGVA